jgi:FKBP-type peptidyl-prolyl cis-trans isomerase FklB
MAEIILTGDLEKFSYALGMSIASNLIKSGVETIHQETFIAAINDTFIGEMPKLLPDEANKILEDFMKNINSGKANKASKNKEAGVEFLAKNRDNEGVVELPSGLQYKVLVPGDGDVPKITDEVQCHYHGTLIDGTVFDSSVERGQPAIFPVNAVIQGWVEALQMMREGSKWQLFIPSDLAYGMQGAGDVIEPDSTLIFEVELLKII